MENLSVENVFMIGGMCLALAVLSVLYDSRHDLAGWWRRVKPSRADYVERAAPPAGPEAATRAPGGPVAATDNGARNVIAMGDNGRNGGLSRNQRLHLQATMIADLLSTDSLYIPDGKGGFKKLGQTALIKLATGLSPNGRPDSEYGALRAELDELMHPRLTVQDGGEVRSIPK